MVNDAFDNYCLVKSINISTNTESVNYVLVEYKYFKSIRF